MTPAVANSRITAGAALQHYVWSRPEWWTIGLSGIAWAILLVHAWQHGGHPMTYSQELGHWVLMVAAMMLPFYLDAVRATAEGSMWMRRDRAIAVFLLGYFAPWLAAGVVAAGVRQMPWAHTELASGSAFALAAVWMGTGVRERAMVACHRRRPLAPFGWKADRDCLRFGATIGRSCVISCWPLMLACALTGHGFVAMIGGMAVGAAERWTFRPRRRAALMGTLTLAGYYFVLAAASPASAQSTDLLGATSAPIRLGKENVTVSVPARRTNAKDRRVYLHIENVTSHRETPAYDVYVNHARPELLAGNLPLFGVVEASRSHGSHPGSGLTYKLDVTELYRRVASGKSIRLLFVPSAWSGDADVRVGRVSIHLAK